MTKLSRRAAAVALAVAVSLAPASAGADTPPQKTEPAAVPHKGTVPAPSPDSFNVATFNMLGGSHTNGRGGFRSGSSRMKGATGYLKKHSVVLAGLQELEPKQASEFLKRTRGKWTLVGAPSRSGKSTDTRNAVVFLKRRFTLLKRSYVPIRYFHGKRVNVPLVKLKSKKNGRVVWVLNTHNPADMSGSNRRWRAVSVGRQLKRIERLHSRGKTVLYTGDMNAKQEFFCRATKSGTLRSASGGSAGKRCRYPKANGIDWVLGTKDVRFARWRSDKSTRSRGISDHPIVVAEATIPPRKR